MPQVTQTTNSQVRLGPINPGASQDFIYPLGPDDITRTYGADYIPLPIALADFSPSSPVYSAVWARNQPERIIMDFLLVDSKTLTGSGADDIETEIRRLEDFRFKDPRTREPPDLVFSIGNQHDLVRLENMTVKPRLYTTDKRRQQARVTMTLLVMKPRGG